MYGDRPDRIPWAVAATLVYLPFHLHHAAGPPGARVHRAACGRSAVVTGGHHRGHAHGRRRVAADLRGGRRLGRDRAAAAVVVRDRGGGHRREAPLAWWLGSFAPAAESYYVLTVAWRSASVFVPMWLIGTIVQLQTGAARRSPRTRWCASACASTGSCARTVGSALDAIAARAEHAGDAWWGAIPAHCGRAADPRRQLAARPGPDQADGHRVPVTVAVRPSCTPRRRSSSAAGIETRSSSRPSAPRPSTLALRTSLRAATAELLG